MPCPMGGCVGRQRSCPAGTGGKGVCWAAHRAQAQPLQRVHLGSPESLKEFLLICFKATV